MSWGYISQHTPELAEEVLACEDVRILSIWVIDDDLSKKNMARYKLKMILERGSGNGKN